MCSNIFCCLCKRYAGSKRQQGPDGADRDQTPTRSRWSRWQKGRKSPKHNQGPDQTQPTKGGLKGPLVQDQRGRASRSIAPSREGQDVCRSTVLDPRTMQASNLEGPDQEQVPKVPSRPPDSQGTKYINEYHQ